MNKNGISNPSTLFSPNQGSVECCAQFSDYFSEKKKVEQKESIGEQ